MDDLISRKSVIEMIKDWNLNQHIINEEDALDDVNALPSAEPERKTGKWIYNSPVTMKCNQCGLVIKDWDWHRFKYCPNCCSDMRGKQE